jgi:hypothetical protein
MQHRKFEQMTPEQSKAFDREVEKESKTDRVDPAKLRELFIASNLKPSQVVMNGEDCRCGLVMLMQSGREGRDYADDFDSSVLYYCMKSDWNLSKHYCVGFMGGWDGYQWDRSDEHVSKAWTWGFDDGVAAWEACKDLANTEDANQ